MSRTREQRRRWRRRLYRAALAILFVVVLVLLLSAVRYGGYLRKLAARTFPSTQPAVATYLPADFDAVAFAEALERFDREQGQCLSVVVLPMEGRSDGP